MYIEVIRKKHAQIENLAIIIYISEYFKICDAIIP